MGKHTRVKDHNFVETPIWTVVLFLPRSMKISGAGTDNMAFAQDLGLEF